MKHDFALDSDGNIDNWQLDKGYHNGPRCHRCNQYFCEHCEQDVYVEECPSGQLSLDIEG